LDSISKYLDLARKVNVETAHLSKDERQQGDISIKDEQAWLYYYEKEYDKAEKEMMEVLALIDSVEAVAPNTILTERGEAYAFLVELYSHTGRSEQALKYQQLQNDNDKERFSVERNVAVREVEAKYDVSKAKSIATRILGVVWILLAVVVALVVVISYYRRSLKHKELKSSVAAMESLVEMTPEVKELAKDVNVERAKDIFAAAKKPLSATQKVYILLFLSGASTEQIAGAMHVDTASVYTVRYRLRKLFPSDFPLPF